MAYGTIESIDAGTCVVAETAWPMRHILGRAKHGWYVTQYACGGDPSMTETESYGQDEAAARAAFAKLGTGEP